MEYAELHCHSNFSFLDGVDPPEALVDAALEKGLAALALTDRDGLYGIVRFLDAARQRGLDALVGAELTLEEGGTLVLLVESPRGYRNLSRLLTHAHGRAPRKGEARAPLATVGEYSDGLIALTGDLQGRLARLLAGGRGGEAERYVEELRDLFGPDRLALEVVDHALPQEAALRRRVVELARRLSLPLVAAGAVRYVEPRGRQVHDVLQAIRHRTTLAAAGDRLLPNAAFHLASPAEMAERFRALPEALATTVELAERCRWTLADLGYALPDFPLSPGETPAARLGRLAWAGARARYGDRLGPAHCEQMRKELSLIDQLDLAGYFLIVEDIVRFCRDRGIFCQGRGSAANSVVCYALGITAVDPIGLDLLFERFLSAARDEPPDIDLDIEHERREEVIQYVFERHGRRHAAFVCEVICFRRRLALREVGKVLGMGPEVVQHVSRRLDGRLGDGADEGAEERLYRAVEAPWRPPRAVFRRWLDLARRLTGIPRHLSQHVGGMVISAGPLAEVVPVEPAAMAGRQVIQWDKDDVATAGLVKIDILGLGILTVIRKGIELIEDRQGRRIDPAQLDYRDPAVYRMLCAADTVGVFQVESRAQRNTLPRLKPQTLYDLAVEIALIRPGPIQGDMVHPYLRRRAGREPPQVPHPCLEPILGRTLGVPLFQEQGMKVAIEAAGFTPAQADMLRRSMGHKRSRAKMAALHGALMEGMARRGIPPGAAQTIARQLESFADYGFPESHALSFASLVYVSAYLKCHYPAEFAAALLNSQPMGFYSPASILADARRHGIEVLPLDVNESAWDWRVVGPPPGRLRAGFRTVRGLGPAHERRLEAARRRGRYGSIEEFARRTGLDRDRLRRLALVGAFRGLGIGRREALWHIEALTPPAPLGLGPAADPPAELPRMSALEAWIHDYGEAHHSPHHWPTEFFRDRLDRAGVLTCERARSRARGTTCSVAGVLLLRQRPPTAKGMTFLTLEDETGMLDVVVRPHLYERRRQILAEAFLLLAAGVVEEVDGAVNLLATDLASCDELLSDRAVAAGRARRRDFH